MVSDNTDFRKVFLVSLLLIVVIIISYQQVNNFDFIGYDDELYVTENLNVQKGLTIEGLIWAFTTFHSANWHPLTWLSHMLDCELYGLNPTGHHWTNVQFHIANTLLLFFILFKMTGALRRSAFVAAFFALHPLHVESVAWVAERKDVLSTFFGFLMIFAYYRYVKISDLKNYVSVIIFLTLGLMAKPMLVTFPFVLFLLDYWPLKRFQFKKDRILQSDRLIFFGFQGFFRLILEKIPFFILAGVSSILTFWAQQSQGAVKVLGDLSLQIRVANALVSYVRYVLKAIWPGNLAVFYPHPGDTLPGWEIIGAALLVAATIFLSIRALKRYPYIPVGLFWYLGTLVPVIGLVQVGNQAMADRYTYIPLIGLFIIAAWGISELLNKWQYRKIFLGISAAIILSVMIVCTSCQLAHWKNGITLFENAVKATKNNYIAQNNLGTKLIPIDIDKAMSHFKEALKIKPDYAMALYNLGNVLEKKGNIDEAINHYLEALRIEPGHAKAHNNLGIALYKKGKYDKAVLHFKKAIKINPQRVDARINLANVLFLHGKLDEAVLEYQETVRINPEHEKAHYNLGGILAKQGKENEAMSHFAEVIRINSGHAPAYNEIGIILARKGKLQKSNDFFLKAIQIKPDYKEARNNLLILKKMVISQ